MDERDELLRKIEALNRESLAAFQVVDQAYLTLLRMPHGAFRACNQDTYSALRDYLAKELGEDAEDVQDKYEARAARTPA